jgi:hypothetical protein
MPAKRALIGVSVLLIGVLACNVQAAPTPDLPATITAQALTLQATSPAAGTATATVDSGVEVSVTSDTNCRTGPSQDFDRVLVVTPGQSFKVVGKNTSLNYWIIQDRAGGTCWLWGRYAVITGDPSTLPEYPAPAAPTPGATNTPKPTSTPEATVKAGPTLNTSAPNPPSNLAYTRNCTAFMEGSIPKWREDITLTWNDNSNDESGFQLWTGPSSNNATLWATVAANTESVNDTRTYSQGTGGQLFDNYQIVAFNANGGTFGGAVDIPRCP